MRDPKKRKINWYDCFCQKNTYFCSDLQILKKLAFAELSDNTIYMCKINMGLLGTVQWYLENERPLKRKYPLIDSKNQSIYVHVA